MTEKIQNEVNAIVKKTVKKNANELKMALIEPLSKEYPFCSNGFYIFCGKMGAGKTMQILKHIMITERMFEGGYYSLIVFCSTSKGLDKTVKTFLPKIKTPMAFVPDTALMDFLRKHIKTKMTYYSIIRWINTNFKVVDDALMYKFKKHSLEGRRVKQIEYVANKIKKYNCNKYPANLLLILDDFAEHPLINKKDSELCRMLTKSRHYNMTTIVTVQTTKFIIKNLKRMCSDVCLWRGTGEEDFYELMKMLPHNFDTDEVWQKYKSMVGNNSMLEIHVQDGTYKLSEA